MMSRNTDPTSQSAVVAVTYSPAIYNGVILADDVALRDIQEALDIAERSADDLALGFALLTMGALWLREIPLRPTEDCSCCARFARCR